MQKFLDANGVQYLWEQISLQDYPNNEVLAATIQAIDDVKLDKKDFPLDSGINQYLTTDSEGNKTWENKLAYSEIKELPFIEEYVWDGTQVDFPRAMVPANAGDKVTLYIDDVPYYGVLEDDDAAWIINFDEEYTHEWIEAMPFYIAKVDHDLSLGIEMEWAVGKMSAIVLTDVVHTLDNKYLGLRIQPGEEEGSMIVNGDGSSPVGYYALSLNDGVATGPRSAAIGASSSASGTYSFATAGGSAKGKYSTSLGEWTEAMADNSLTIGTHNITDENKEYLFIIGNGNKGEFNPQIGYERVYSNAHTVNKDGTGWFQKEIKVGGTNEHDNDAKTVLATSTPNIHQVLTSNENGDITWENKLCYNYRQEYQVHEGFTVPAGTKMLHGQTPDVIEPIIKGETYTVIWDNVEYTCVAREEPDSSFGVVLGNLHLLESQYEDTGEPFEIIGWYQHNMAQIIMCADTAGHICGGVKGSKTHYTAIDGRHIAGGVYRGKGSQSTIIGQGYANGNSSIAMNSATVDATSAFGEGFSHVHSDAIHAHGEGTYTDVYGASGHVEGYATASYGFAQHVQGMLNIIDEEGKYAHIVGNGEDSVRSNAHTLDWNGNAWYAGKVKIGGSGQDDENAKELIYAHNTSLSNQYLTTDVEGKTVWEDKICCTEIGEVTFFDEDILYPYAGNIYNLYGYIGSQPMIAGETYKVITNGTTYECVAKYNENNDIYIGNDSIQNPDSEDTGEPFFIMHILPDSAAFCMLKEPHDDWTFTIVGPGEIIRVIPGEYIAGGLYKGNGKDSFCVKDTEANGDYAWALGGSTKANGYYSMALGLGSETDGAGCIAEGDHTIAASPYQHAQGRYNIEDADRKYVHIVGNGKREYGVTTRSNAHALDWNGNSYYAGDVYVQGDGETLEFNGAKKVATEEYVNLKITNLINSAPETLDTIGEVAKALQEHQNVADALNSAIGNKVDKTDIEGLASQSYVDTKVNELFQNVSDGKELIASAITDKGVYASEDETFQELSNKISLIPVGPPGSNIIGYVDEENDIYVSLTELENGTYTLKFEDQNGLLNDFDDIGTVEVK